MAPQSKISQLPDDLVDELDALLRDNDYGDIDGTHAWLTSEIEARGVELEESISRSAVGRYSRMRKLQTATIAQRVQQMRAFQDEFGDDPLAFVQNGNNAAQMLAFYRLEAAMNGDVTVDEDFLKDISLALGRMAKTALINDERERKIREEERKRVTETAGEAVESAARKAGVSPDGIAAMRAAITQELTG